MTRDAEHTPNGYEDAASVGVSKALQSVVVPGSAWERFLYRSDFLRGAAVVDGHDVSLRSFASLVEELKAAAAPAPSSLAGGEVMRLVPDRVLTEALYWMARGYERVHSMPRVSDTELANKIEAAKADLGRARDASPALSVPIQQESA